MNSPRREAGTPPKAGPPNRDPGERTVGSVDNHTTDVVARARARLAALVRRPSAPAIQRLSRLMPGVAGRIDQPEAAAYDEAARNAFRAATTLGSVRPLAHAPTTGLPASASQAELAGASISGSTTPGATPAAPAAPTATPATTPAAPTDESRTPASWAPSPFAPVSAWTVPAVAPANKPVPRPAAAEAPAARHRRQAGETAPDRLLRPSENVDSAAGDFFDGLVRLVEGKR